jgi:hypothetical protein
VIALSLLVLATVGGVWARRVERRRCAVDIVVMSMPDRPGTDGQWSAVRDEVRAIRKSIRRHDVKVARRRSRLSVE